MKAAMYTDSELTSVLNDGLDVYLLKLKAAGVIDDAKMEEMQQYRFVVSNKRTFGEYFRRFFTNDDETHYQIVKVL